MSRIEQLILAYMEDRLDPAEAQELADLLAKDRAARDEFIEIYRLHRLLSAQYTTPQEADFVGSVLADLRRETGNVTSDPANEPQSQNWLMHLIKVTSEIRSSVRDQIRRNLGFWFQFFRPSRAGWVAAAVLVAVVSGFLVFRSSPLSAEITKTSAGVVVIRGGRSLVGYEGFRLKNSDTLQTPTNGTTVIQFPGEKTTLALSPGSQLHFQGVKHGKHLNLKAGEIVVIAGHQPTNAPMVIETAQAEARVVGTRFQLAARRFSTWLGVTEGAVAFLRKPGVSGGQQPAGSPSELKQVLVAPGEYSVAADGIPLEKYQVTDQLNLARPLPIKIGWFNYYAAPNWYIHPPYIQQTQPATITRTFQLPAIKGSILAAGTVTVNLVKPGLRFADGGVGCGIGLSAGSDYFLACVQQRDGQPVLEIADLGKVPLANGQPPLEVTVEDMVSLAEVPLSDSVWPSCQVKFVLERGLAREAVVRAKAWSGAHEPKDWQVSAPVKLRGSSDVFELRLMTQNSACTFENTSAFLVE